MKIVLKWCLRRRHVPTLPLLSRRIIWSTNEHNNHYFRWMQVISNVTNRRVIVDTNANHSTGDAVKVRFVQIAVHVAQMLKMKLTETNLQTIYGLCYMYTTRNHLLVKRVSNKALFCGLALPLIFQIDARTDSIKRIFL
jgi:hypothetical protein